MEQQPKIGQEMQKMPYEPLLPIEKKLIGWKSGVRYRADGDPDPYKSRLFPGWRIGSTGQPGLSVSTILEPLSNNFAKLPMRWVGQKLNLKRVNIIFF